MYARLDPKLDVVFKLLFAHPSNRELLISLLTAVLRPSSPIREVEILNPEIPKDMVADKGIVLDVHVRLEDGRHVDIEMQSTKQLSFSSRALFYLARMYSNNLHLGQDYGDLKSCVSILILDYPQWQTERFHCTFHVSEDRSHERFSDAIEIHTIELPKLPRLAESAKAEAGEQPLLAWSQFIAARSEEDLETLAMNNPVIAKARTALDRLSSDPEVQSLVEARLRAEVGYKLEIAAVKAEGLREGKEEGLREGKEEGLREGEARGLREAVENMCRVLGIEWSPARQARVTAMEVQDLRHLLASLSRSRQWPEG
ncbi:MAG: Rpn family recombination-promoting nuclease/putative transposase [Deltaproteobacteria bacterium]|nr:Rpn family recombination-promoting nuclease/putative transposase [Deltaproteobacteria bacterium]